MFVVIISVVFWSWPPEDTKLVLFDLVVYPIEPHVHGIGLLLVELLSCDAYSSGIVHFGGCGSIFPKHFIEAGVDGYRCFGVDKYGAVFGFGC